MKTLTLLPAKNIITNIHQKIHLSTQLKSWILFIMLVAGLEPARTNCSTDFKSVASAYSAIPADYLHCKIKTGWRWIRTTEAICSRFTVCPL